jgi:endonuclease YncB( thermonuclease family)
MGNCICQNNDNDNDNDNLKKATLDVEKFTLEGTSMYGKMVHIYDGDTVHIVFSINNKLTKFICRLAHIDTPEMSSKIAVEKENAIKARNYLFEKMTNIKITDNNISKKELDILCGKSVKLVWVKCFEFDKYGRLLVELYEDNISNKSFNSDLIDLKYANPYEGKTKLVFS